MKRKTTILLPTSILLFQPLLANVNAYEVENSIKLEYNFDKNYVESLVIDGKSYNFIHYEKDGYRIIKITGAEEGVFKVKINSKEKVANVLYKLSDGVA